MTCRFCVIGRLGFLLFVLPQFFALLGCNEIHVQHEDWHLMAGLRSWQWASPSAIRIDSRVGGPGLEAMIRHVVGETLSAAGYREARTSKGEFRVGCHIVARYNERVGRRASENPLFALVQALLFIKQEEHRAQHAREYNEIRITLEFRHPSIDRPIWSGKARMSVDRPQLDQIRLAIEKMLAGLPVVRDADEPRNE